MTKLVATLLVAGFALAACGGDERSGSVPLASGSTTGPATTPPTTTATTATEETPGPATTPATAAPGAPSPAPTTAPTESLAGFQTEPFRREHALTVPPVPQVVAVRTARHDGFDRVVFDFDGPLPGAVSVRYVDRVVGDGSGEPIAVAGSAFLQVRFEEAQAHTDSGAPTIPRRSQPGLAAIAEIVVAGDFEGYVTVALGLRGSVPFRVIELGSPTRVVVDVRTP